MVKAPSSIVIILAVYALHVHRWSFLTDWAQNWESTPCVPGAQAAILSRALCDIKRKGMEATRKTWNDFGLLGLLCSTLKAAFPEVFSTAPGLGSKMKAILEDKVGGAFAALITHKVRFGEL